MLDIFRYTFMQRALISGLLIAIILPCIGIIITLKRLSMIGDALSHTSLAGVALGLILGFDPIIGAVLSCIIAAFSIEFIRKKMPKFSEISIAIIMSSGIGLAGFLSSFVNQPTSFNSFLFGSIVAISQKEFMIICGLAVIVFATYILLYKQLFYVAYDDRAAKLSGVPVKSVNFIFTVITALTVSIASRTVGALMVSSLMVIPVACAMQLSKGFKVTLISSSLFAIGFTVTGLFLSIYKDFKPGGTIVLIGVVCFIIILLGKWLFSKIAKKRLS